MADLPSSGAGENESAAVEGEAGHVVVQIDDKPEEVEQVEPGECEAGADL